MFIEIHLDVEVPDDIKVHEIDDLKLYLGRCKDEWVSDLPEARKLLNW